MRYALAVLTHDTGDEGETLRRSIASFDEHVWPPPVARFVYCDGRAPLPPIAPYPWTAIVAKEQQGFCVATRRLWQMAAEDPQTFDYVFWLEHDFEFRRTVNVERMARILDDDDGTELVQVALMRGPANESERKTGGLYAEMLRRGHSIDQREDHFIHRAFFTTNPSLMSRAFMRWVPFPEYDSECEGRFGYDLRQDGYRFACMGAGEPWVKHFGKRTTGKGY